MEVHMLLRKLLAEFSSFIDVSHVPDLEILGVRDDSRQVKVGDLFIARPGTKTDGARFVADAQANGAVAVVVEKRIEECSLPQVLVPDSATATSVLAHRYYGSPSEKVK